jgi:hypothetical protein
MASGDAAQAHLGSVLCSYLPTGRLLWVSVTPCSRLPAVPHTSTPHASMEPLLALEG